MVKYVFLGISLLYSTSVLSGTPSTLDSIELTLKSIELVLPKKENSIVPKEEPIVFDENVGARVNMNTDIGCLTSNIFFEAGNQSLRGMLAVAQTTIRRANTFHGGSICKTVKHANYKNDGTIIKNECHFSWFCDGKPVKFVPNDAKSKDAWDSAYTVAHSVLKEPEKLTKVISTHDHYCTLKVEHRTSWVKDMKKSSRLVVGDHVFYEHDPVKFEKAWKRYVDRKKKGVTT